METENWNMDEECIPFSDTPEMLRERYYLAADRIREIPGEALCGKIPEAIRAELDLYFRSTADYLSVCFATVERLGDSLFSDEGPKVAEWKDFSLQEWEEMNRSLYAPFTGDAYRDSFADPEKAERLGTYGPVLSFLLAEIYGFPQYIFDGKLYMLVNLSELFLLIHGQFCQEEAPAIREIETSVQEFYRDTVEKITELRILDTMVPKENTAVQIVTGADLSDLRYLYQYGEYISGTEISVARFFQTLSEEEIDSMARTFSEGFRRGFETMRIPFEGKNSVNIRYAVGQERMIRSLIRDFREMGLSPILARCAGSRVNRKGVVRQGIQSTEPSRQFSYDHRMDEAVFLTPSYPERRLSALKRAYESIPEALAGYAGPALVETFGEEVFVPERKESCISLTEEQQKLLTRMGSQAGQLMDRYLPGDSYSFSIIAYPIPEIGKDFEAIFRDTVRVNTLENATYLPMQQKLIDAMDPADYILVRGRGENRTEMKVKMRKLSEPERQTQFENCVADVNIPLGEVFTSPVLAGTEGTLHVSGVYLNGYFFRDLTFVFRDGCVMEYSCGNYEDPEEGRKYIRENILFHHETLPIGEFAIGTNMPAYQMAKKYGILGRLPILIVEKTGPHFAVGDTCYSHAEETAVYNPDGKEIISRENAFSLLRDKEPEKAYFNCHTDITIPYEEIGVIAAVYPDGSMTELIRDGRFVLPGTEGLNT